MSTIERCRWRLAGGAQRPALGCDRGRACAEPDSLVELEAGPQEKRSCKAARCYPLRGPIAAGTARSRSHSSHTVTQGLGEPAPARPVAGSRAAV